MQPLTQQSPTVALAAVAEQRGPAGIALSEALAASPHTDQWIRDIALLETAKSHFAASHFEECARVCDTVIERSEEDTTLRGRALRLLAAATMAQSPAEEDQNRIEGWLDEAQQIFETNRDGYQLGQVFRLQGVLSYWQGEADKGAELIMTGERLENAFMPRASTNGWQPPRPAIV